MIADSNLSWQGITRKAVYTKGAGLVCKCTGQCTLEGSVQSVGDRDLGVQNYFFLVFKLYAVAILPLTAICPWNLFCHDHSRPNLL